MKINKTTIAYIAAIVIFTSAINFALFYNYNKRQEAKQKNYIPPSSNSQSLSCNLQVNRLTGFKYISPLLFSEPTCPSTSFDGIKFQLSDLIQNFKKTGAISSASVYLRTFNNAQWMSINQSETFNPGSLIKVPFLIANLLMEQKKPGYLNTKLTFIPNKDIPLQTYNSHQIHPGNSYTVKELLKYMIAYSDNNATYLINNNTDLDIFRKIYLDLGLPNVDPHDPNYQITAKDYSQFLKVIYNASYLDTPSSQFAAGLLSQSDFTDGLAKNLPPDITIAHKFGEFARPGNPEHQLSESGIIYLNNSPYLITVMTKGNDVKSLANAISQISKKVFDSINQQQASL